MMRLLLHGPAKQVSRKKLIDLKGKFDPNNIVVFEEGADLRIIKESLSAQSLFEQEQLIILENPTDLNFDSLTLNDSLTLALWFDHEIDPKKFSGFEISFFPESKELSVFPFLDLLANKDRRAYLEMDKLRKNSFDIHYLLIMVFYLLRSLAVTPNKAPDFVRKKLERQRANFPLEKVTELYKEIIEIDFKIKSGLLEKEHAEFLLVSSLLRA
ncbi:hypothetical protein HYS95_01335 [Candidatus Daviesbacteria bacterium]|nr:hypothetical protein [Candidatus Daviesbacteria bacterium]